MYNKVHERTQPKKRKEKTKAEMKLVILIEALLIIYIVTKVHNPFLALICFLLVNLLPLGYLWIKYLRYFK